MGEIGIWVMLGFGNFGKLWNFEDFVDVIFFWYFKDF